MDQIRILLEQGEFSASASLIQQLPEPEQSTMLGWWLLYQGESDALNDLLDRVLEIHPDVSELHLLAGLLHDHYENPQTALLHFRQSLDLNWNTTAFFNALHIYLGFQQFHDANTLVEFAEPVLKSTDLSDWEWEQFKLIKAQISRHLGNPREAIQLLLSLEHPDANSFLLMGHIYRDEYLYTESLMAYQQGLEHEPHNVTLQSSVEAVIALLHSQTDNPTKASGQRPLEMRRYLEETLATLMTRDETDPETIHLKNALMNRQTAQPPAGYVEELFDDYAERFDAHLVEKLNYQVPHLVSSVVNRFLERATNVSILDLGCGTGLVANQLQLINVERLVGVDISQKMLDKAASRLVYSELIKSDIQAYVAEAECFDVIVIADTLVYLGELESLFSMVSQHLHDGGKWVFTVEQYFEQSDVGYHLQHTGRYAHTSGYIEGLLHSLGLQSFHVANVQLRQGAGAWVEGLLYVVDK